MPYNDENLPKDTEEKPETVEDKLKLKKPFAWENFDASQKELTRQMADDYFDFLYNARTERERTIWTKNFAEKVGFVQLEIGKDINRLNPGDKVFYINRNKNIVLIIIGNKPMTEGTRLIGAHIDTPRLDLKMRPLYEKIEKLGLALWKTHYYGGIKKYQWATIPLHLTGVIIKKDGTSIPIEIGKDPKDPVFTIPDVLIHLSRKVQGKRTTFEVIKGEEMNVLAGSLPFDGEGKKDVKEKFKTKVLEILHEKYDINEADLQSAELNLVSGIMPRYVGLDKALIGAPGHDDGVCSWAGVRAIVDTEGIPPFTCLTALFDKEEIGSSGNTGAQSAWIQFVVNDLLVRTGTPETLTNLHLAMSNSLMLSADVGSAMNPNFTSVHDLKNAAIIGKGPVLEKYTGSRGKYDSSDASAEIMAKLRGMFDAKQIPYQVVELGKVDEGGGGTIAKYFAQSFNCDVIDAGTPVINMHSPFELIHISDLYTTYLLYKTFYEDE